MRPLWEAYRVAAHARDQRSPLDLDLPERRIIMGRDGKIESIAFRERLESMRLIEEFMIMANVSAAETLEKARVPLIYRVHDDVEGRFSLSGLSPKHRDGVRKGRVMKPAAFNRILARQGAPHQGRRWRRAAHQAQTVYAENIGHLDWASRCAPLHLAIGRLQVSWCAR
jgi:ribonuclease R